MKATLYTSMLIPFIRRVHPLQSLLGDHTNANVPQANQVGPQQEANPISSQAQKQRTPGKTLALTPSEVPENQSKS